MMMNLSQATFGAKCGVTRAHLGRIERGEVNVSFENIQRIARALGLKPSWLLDKADQ